MSHTTSPMEAARRQWWDGLSKEGDPSRIVNPLSSGFRAGWEAAGSINADLLNMLTSLEVLVGFMFKYARVHPAWESTDTIHAALEEIRKLVAKATGGAE